MSTIVYRNARLLVDGSDLTTKLHELNVEYSAEMLDQTVFGFNTRLRQGGLKVARLTGKGFFDDAAGVLGVEAVMFNQNGVDDLVFTMFPDGITEGDSCGYGIKGVLSEFNFGEGGVGAILGVSFAAETRGLT